MSIPMMIFREIRTGWVNFLLGLLVTALTTGIFFVLQTLSTAADKSFSNTLRDMGFNILIVPKGTAMERYWSLDFPDAEMPEAHVQTLAASDVSAEHFVAKLQQTTVLNGRTVVLTGVLPSLGRIGRETGKKKPMGFDVPPGAVFAGSAAAHGLALKKDSRVTLFGHELKVDRILPETGTFEDLRLLANQHDVQAMLGKEGRINAIDALGCRCFIKGDFMTQIREQIERVLPDTQVHQYKSIAMARELIRRRMDQFALYVFAAALVLGAAGLASLTYLNVRQRRHEIGLLRTVGARTPQIAALFLGKVLLYSLAGAALGALAGALVLEPLGQHFLETSVGWDPPLLLGTILVAPLVAVVFGALPICGGLWLDPATVLREQ